MIRFYNGKVLSLKNGTEITDDEVWVDGSKIVYVGKSFDKKADREINLNGNLLMPSFKNAHTHSAMTFARSLADDLPLQPWLYDMIFPMEAKLTGEQRPQRTVFFPRRVPRFLPVFSLQRGGRRQILGALQVPGSGRLGAVSGDAVPGPALGRPRGLLRLGAVRGGRDVPLLHRQRQI